MTDPVETLTSKCGRFRALIFIDPEPLNPRLEWDNFCTMLVWHRRYNLGDPSPNCDRKSGRGWEWDERYKSRAYLEGSALKDSEYGDGRFYANDCSLGPGLVLPLYLYDHSGLTISTGAFSCPWDSGQVGWIHCSFEKASSELLSHPLKNPRRSKILREKMLDCIDAEVETYDQYLHGDVYGYELQSLDDRLASRVQDGVVSREHRDGDWLVEDSCWGFFGLDDIRQEVRSLLDHYSRKEPSHAS